MTVDDWEKPSGQTCTIGHHTWGVSRLIALAKELPVQEVSIDAIYMDMKLSDDGKLRDMAMHFKAVMATSLDCPIILDEDGGLMDGRHRIVRALIEGAKTIKFVRFEKNPTPDKTE